MTMSQARPKRRERGKGNLLTKAIYIALAAMCALAAHAGLADLAADSKARDSSPRANVK
jgi:hypothetical protein